MEESKIIMVSGLDTDTDKEFYGPVPAIYCFFFGVPVNVYMVATELNGQRLSVCEAVNRIQAVTDLVVFIDSQNSLIGIRLENSFHAKNARGKDDIDVICFR